MHAVWVDTLFRTVSGVLLRACACVHACRVPGRYFSRSLLSKNIGTPGRAEAPHRARHTRRVTRQSQQRAFHNVCRGEPHQQHVMRSYGRRRKQIHVDETAATIESTGEEVQLLGRAAHCKI